MSQVSSPTPHSSTQRHRVQLNSKTVNGRFREASQGHVKAKSSRVSSQYQDEPKSTWPRSRHPVVTSVALSEDNLYALSKSQVAHFSAAAPGSRVYPTVSTTRQHLPKPHAGRAVEQSPSQDLTAKTRPISTSSSTDLALKQHTLRRSQHVSETTKPRQTVRIPTKPSSRSTLASSSRQSSTSREALCPGDVASSGLQLKKSRSSSSSGSRSLSQTRGSAVINERVDITKGRRELKPIDEVDSAGKQQLRSSLHSQLPTRPPGLDVAAAGSSTKAALRPVPSASALLSSEHDIQTKILSQLLDRTSLDGPAGTQDRALGFSQDQQAPTSKFSLILLLSDPDRLAAFVQYLPFEDWCNLLEASSEVRLMVSCNELLREEVLERYLGDLGYSRWIWREPEPIMLSLSDLKHHIQLSSIPLREYTRVAEQYLMSQSLPVAEQDQEVTDAVQRLANATRAYNRVVLRIRAQAEMLDSTNDDPSDAPCSFSAPSSRRSSQYSHRPYSHPSSSTASFLSGTSASVPQSAKRSKSNFHSPLYRPGRAALLRVFVPSQGEWLSDASVLECEAELKRAGLPSAMRLGDVVWDVALADEGSNVGKMIWDGSYLLDLDYTYSSAGDLPKHIPSLALPPSYFHRIITTGPLDMDPIVRIDVSPWGHEIARNLQLMQDKLVIGTPQGQLQNAVKWVHRSTFMIRPPPSSPNTLSSKRSTCSIRSQSNSGSGGIPITTSNGHHTVHPSWYGAVIIETDGSNESLEDLKERCGLGAFPRKTTSSRKQKDGCEKMVWRILRDKSRPGEIWIRLVGPRERLM